MRAKGMRGPRRYRERAAQREVLELRATVLGHWAACKIDGEWTPEKHQFFLDSARRKRGLDA
jgi:hypothetical protein